MSTKEYVVFYKFFIGSRPYSGTVGTRAGSEAAACGAVRDQIITKYRNAGLDEDSIILAAS